VSGGRREIELHIWLRIDDLRRSAISLSPDTGRSDAVTINSVSTKSRAVQLPDVQYFEIPVREGEVVLRPAVVSAPGERLSAVRTKMRALGLSEKDVDDAITWARRRRR
jgi:hypothetical protein